MAIQFFQEDVSYRIRKKHLLRQWLQTIANKHKKEIEFVNIILCSDSHLLEINRQFLQHDYFTDVITFPYHEPHKPIQGDIYISIDRVKAHAAELSIKTAEELHRVMAHGLLHLLGFKDDNAKQKNEMTRWEDHHLAALNEMFHVER